MKHSHLTSLLLILTLLSACLKQEIPVNSNTLSINESEISVVDGHLRFSTSQSFQEYISTLIDLENCEGETKAANNTPKIPGFTSLAEMIRHPQTKGLNTSDEEMSIHEFRIYKAESLLIDPILTHVMDTTLTIEVEDRLFKVTDAGTFAIRLGSVENIYSAIADFDTTYIYSLANGESIAIDDDITFINTFGNNSINNKYFTVSESIDEDDEYDYDEITKATTTSEIITNNLHNGYNTIQYKWQNNSLWQKLWDAIRGKNVSRECNIDNTHRVQVTVYDVNYAFLASSGITVKMQRQKRFLGIKYWTSEKADKIAIGFNYLYGKYTLKNPTSYSVLAPSNFKTFSSFTSNLNNKAYKFWYGKYSQIPYLKDWVNDMVLFIPDVKILGQNVTNQDVLNMLYELPAKFTFNFLKSQAKKVYDPVAKIEKLMEKKDPRMAYFVWGKNVLNYTQDKSYITGVKEYPNLASKTVRFDFSVGFYWNNSLKIPIPMQISSFNIESIDAFGAVFYKGAWKGVRFVD